MIPRRRDGAPFRKPHGHPSRARPVVFVTPERVPFHGAFHRAHERFRASIGQVIPGAERAGLASVVRLPNQTGVAEPGEFPAEFVAFWGGSVWDGHAASSAGRGEGGAEHPAKER